MSRVRGCVESGITVEFLNVIDRPVALCLKFPNQISKVRKLLIEQKFGRIYVSINYGRSEEWEYLADVENAAASAGGT